MSKAKRDPLLDAGEAGSGKKAAKPEKVKTEAAKPADAGEAGSGAGDRDRAPWLSAAVLEKDIKAVHSEQIRIVKEKLAKCPVVTVSIPLAPGEREGAYDTVSIQGYKVQVKKGVQVELPQPMAKILLESYRITAAAGKEKLADRDDAIASALA